MSNGPRKPDDPWFYTVSGGQTSRIRNIQIPPNIEPHKLEQAQQILYGQIVLTNGTDEEKISSIQRELQQLRMESCALRSAAENIEYRISVIQNQVSNLTD